MCYYIILVLHRDKQQMRRTLRRQDKKIKEYQTAIDDERRAAEQYKDQVGIDDVLLLNYNRKQTEVAT